MGKELAQMATTRAIELSVICRPHEIQVHKSQEGGDRNKTNWSVILNQLPPVGHDLCLVAFQVAVATAPAAAVGEMKNHLFPEVETNKPNAV